MALALISFFNALCLSQAGFNVITRAQSENISTIIDAPAKIISDKIAGLGKTSPSPTPIGITPTPTALPHNWFIGRPIKVEIPALDLTAGVTPVGVTPKGTIEVPLDSDKVGWYEQNNIRPGQIGLALLTGHYDTVYRQKGVFYHLRELKENEVILIETEKGSRLIFQVTGLFFEPYDGFSHDLIYGNSESAEIRLITCHGSWDTAAHTYNQRLVVSARLANEVISANER